MTQRITPSASALGADGVAGLPEGDSPPADSSSLADELDGLFRDQARVQGLIVRKLAAAGAAHAYRADGATSLETWTAERFGVSSATARTLVRVAERAPDMPALVESLCAGDISFDKVRVVAPVAGPRWDHELVEAARTSSVRALAEVARGMVEPPGARVPDSRTQHDGRYLRFNDTCRTMTLQLPADAYAETRACIEARTAGVPDEDKKTPLDQRRCDGFMDLVRSSEPGAAGGLPGTSHYIVVAHVPLSALIDGAGGTDGADGLPAGTDLAGELERDGLIDLQTVRRVACDATIVVGVDDDAGHTMYEGRQQRFATPTQRREVWRRDRHCRFPGCDNVMFTAVHHIQEWKPGGGTDLPNLALLCQHHHARVHSDGWKLSGNANDELTFETPAGRAMASRPSPLWAGVTGGPAAAAAAAAGSAAATSAGVGRSLGRSAVPPA